MESGGFQIEVLITQPGRDVEGKDIVEDLLLQYGFPTGLRGEQTFCLARKAPILPRVRFPHFLYD
jgi:hypothetical protein